MQHTQKSSYRVVIDILKSDIISIGHKMAAKCICNMTSCGSTKWPSAVVCACRSVCIEKVPVSAKLFIVYEFGSVWRFIKNIRMTYTEMIVSSCVIHHVHVY